LNTPADIIHPVAEDIVLAPLDNERLANLCGPMDEHLRQIERRVGIEINNRGNCFRIIGTRQAVESGGRLLVQLYEATRQERLSPERIHLFLQDSRLDEEPDDELTGEIGIQTKRGVIRGRSPNQRLYLANIQAHDISFGIGPAGTGKTYLAVASAVAALEQERARRLVLVRPAVEAG